MALYGDTWVFSGSHEIGGEGQELKLLLLLWGRESLNRDPAPSHPPMRGRGLPPATLARPGPS